MIDWQSATIREGRRQTLTKRKAVKLLKKKFRQYYVPRHEYSSSSELEMLRELVYRHETWIEKEHTCQLPETGWKVEGPVGNPIIIGRK